MKKLLFTLFLVLLLLISCNKNNLLEETISPLNTSIDISENDVKQVFYVDILYPQSPQLTPTIDCERNWENYIYDISRESVNVDIEYIESDIFLNSKDSLLEENNGAIYVDTKKKLIYLINNNLIQPVNEYLALITENESFDENTIEMYSDTSGNLWGIPTHNNISISAREYSEDILSKYNIKVPETIDDFYEVAKRVRSIEESNIYISKFNITFLTRDFKDVFNSYGCYIKGYDGFSYPYGYNPETGKYVDYINSENFKNAVSFIKVLKDNGSISSDNSQYEYLSQYKFYRSGQMENSSIVINNTEQQYIEVTPAPFSCFAILINNNNTDVYLDFILNELYQKDELKIAFTYGIEDYHYSLFNGEMIFENNVDLKERFFGMMIDYNNIVYGEIETEYSKNIYATNITAIEYDKAYISECIAELFYDILYNNIEINDAIESYNIKTKSSEMQEFLLELNKK